MCASAGPEASVARLDWGCAPGWVNSDRLAGPGIEVSADIRDGLPLPSDAFDYAVSIHGLQDLPYLDVVPTLREQRRLLRPGGVLRLAVPDLDRAIAAYLRGDRGYFFVPDSEARSLGGKLCVQMTWYGASRSLFTGEFLEELCRQAAFRRIARCASRRRRAGVRASSSWTTARGRASSSRR